MARLIQRRCLLGGAPTPTEVIPPQINSAQSTSMWTGGSASKSMTHLHDQWLPYVFCLRLTSLLSSRFLKVAQKRGEHDLYYFM
jgi:hypothetical protein